MYYKFNAVSGLYTDGDYIMTIKFYKSNQAETIRKVFNTETEKVIAFIGRVDELIKKEIIFPDEIPYQSYNKWLSITNEEDPKIEEFSSLEEAKDYWRE